MGNAIEDMFSSIKEHYYEQINATIMLQEKSLDDYQLVYDSVDGLDIDTDRFDFTVDPIGTKTLDISFSGDKDELVTIVRCFRKLGYEPTERPDPNKKTDSWYSSWFKDGDEDSTRIWFSFSSTVCRRIQTGTRTEEVPIYEIQCDDEITGIEEELI